MVIGLGLFGSFGNDLGGFDLDNLVASVVLVAMIGSGYGVNCFSGFQPCVSLHQQLMMGLL